MLTVMLFLPEEASAATENEKGSLWGWASTGLGLTCILYAFLALKTAYRQSVSRTLLKGLGLAFGYSVLLGTGMLATLVATFILYRP